MKVLSGPIGGWGPIKESTALTLGVFDGVHLGHRAVLAHAFRHPGVEAVITFHPHPVEVLAPGTPPRLLTTIDERLDLFNELGVELTAVLDLTEVRNLAPDEFVSQVLVDRMKAIAVTVGEDFRFGKDRAGDAAFLCEAGERLGFEVVSVPLVGNGGTISSTRIRTMIEEGRVGEASVLLGAFYRIRGDVVDGDKRGRQLGFPTANLRPLPEKVLPADGVYATRVIVKGETFMGAANVGTRPTFGPGERLVEVYILDFDDEIYGEPVTMEFVRRIRPEVAFESVDALVGRMESDVVEAKKILAPVMG